MLMKTSRSATTRRYGNIGDLLVEVVAADGLYRFLADQQQDHRQVARREAPKNVLFAPDLPEIEAVRIDVSPPPQRALAHQFLRLQKGRPGGLQNLMLA